MTAVLPEDTVRVRRQWNDAVRIATYRLTDMHDFHWSAAGGGFNAPPPHAFVHAYVPCDAMLDGELAHACGQGSGPHSIKVCIAPIDNTPTMMDYVTTLAERSSSG